MLVAVALAYAGPARANADQDAARLVAAAGLINAGKLDDAAKILEDLRRRDPANIQVLRLLGRAYLRNKQFDQALAVMQEILAKQPDAPQELYGIGVIHAAQHETDAAFEWLGKAKATRRIDMTMIQTDPNLAGLHDDPRFAALLPKPEDFENPFVENVKIIREWDGEGANDQFGWIARSLGDVDGDGVADFVTSAPTQQCRRRAGRPRLRVFDAAAASCCGRSTASPATSSAPAWNRPATSTATACRTSSPARPAAIRPTSIPARTATCC